MMLIRLVKFLIVLILLVNLFLWLWPFALLALSVVNRSSACPMSRVLQLIREDRHYCQVRDRIRQTSRLVKEDPAGFHLWDTPKGPVRIPADSGRLVAALGLAASKLLAVGLGGFCIWSHRDHIIRWMNCWYAALVLRNLCIILALRPVL